MKLLDTTFLIHYWGGHRNVRRYLERNDGSEFATTTLNLKEIAVGRKLQGKFDRQEILATFDWTTILPFEPDHAFIAAEFEAELHRSERINQDGINSLAGDLLIAAVAKQLGGTVVTENTDDFERFDGVSAETY